MDVMVEDVMDVTVWPEPGDFVSVVSANGSLVTLGRVEEVTDLHVVLTPRPAMVGAYKVPKQAVKRWSPSTEGVVWKK